MHYVNQPKAESEPTWHTIFSGSKQWNCGGSDTTNWITGLPSNVQKFRATGQVYLEPAHSSGTAHIKFTLADGTQTYYKEESGVSAKTYTFTDVEFMKIYHYSSGYNEAYITTISFDAATGALTVKGLGGSSGGYSGYLKFTKIEALY